MNKTLPHAQIERLCRSTLAGGHLQCSHSNIVTVMKLLIRITEITSALQTLLQGYHFGW